MIGLLASLPFWLSSHPAPMHRCGTVTFATCQKSFLFFILEKGEITVAATATGDLIRLDIYKDLIIFQIVDM
ncbi:hypothetical protein AMJ52_08345 [candidate division TA06 bacterium DG_78]|uniref:Uncharacterized protein n=1 Tax=candidate division TA06 bacterium DG_78 TaxID=1703772 RepID=A0A0S7YAP8_UNCT6|nr:MAG: hypothetical protein AMJ52_08345 [candidate division TA06 bacterium DG_78]